MLPLEQCQGLAAWGMPQGIKPGDWYWEKHIKEAFAGRICLCTDPDEKIVWEYFKIPSLAELMEFAKTLDGGWTFSPDRLGWCAGKIFHENAVPTGYVDSNPKLAVYQLIEKLMEVEDE